MPSATQPTCEPGTVCHFPPPDATPEQITLDLPAAPACPDYIRVRRGVPADAPAIAAIGTRQFAETHAGAFAPDDLAAYLADVYNPDHLAADLADPATYFVVAYDRQQPGSPVIGFLRLHPDPAPACVTAHKPVELARFYLDKAWIGRGVGKLLMQSALAQAAADGYDAVWLHVWDHNAHALGVYEHWGYAAMCDAEVAFGHSFPCLLVMQANLTHDAILDPAVFGQ
jgi:ribosomal protein S18 acetylase RimI-like enzyme